MTWIGPKPFMNRSVPIKRYRSLLGGDPGRKRTVPVVNRLGDDQRSTLVEHQAGLGKDRQPYGQIAGTRRFWAAHGSFGIKGKIAIENGMNPGDLDSKRTGVGNRTAGCPIRQQAEGAFTGPERRAG